MILNELSSDDIYLIINSPDGSISAGCKICDYIKYVCRCDVVTIANGRVVSMVVFLLAAGTHGKRCGT